MTAVGATAALLGAATGGLTTGGTVFLVLGWGGILGGTVYCFVKLFRTRDRR